VLVFIGIPAILSISAFWQEAPVRVGEPSPRTVLAPDPIRVDDPETTERERRNAAESVDPILVPDNEARAAIVQSVDDTFARIEKAREPGTGDQKQVLSVDEQVASLLDQLELGPSAIRELVELDDEQLVVARAQAIELARDLAQRDFSESELPQTVDRIDSLLAVRSFPGDVGQTAVKPILELALQPTVRVDEAATAAERDRAAAAVAPLQKSFAPGAPIVQVGETVTEVQMSALRSRGLEGADPWLTAGRALALTTAIAASLAFYLRAYRRRLGTTALRAARGRVRDVDHHPVRSPRRRPDDDPDHHDRGVHDAGATRGDRVRGADLPCERAACLTPVSTGRPAACGVAFHAGLRGVRRCVGGGVRRAG
jgi:membrane-associated HD superfamily phosphohydrolase